MKRIFTNFKEAHDFFNSCILDGMETGMSEIYANSLDCGFFEVQFRVATPTTGVRMANALERIAAVLEKE